MWGRRIMLEVLNPQTGETLFYFDEHRMDFVYEGRGGGHIGDVCTINLFNLSQDLIKMFADSGKDPTTQIRNFMRVRLSAWHEDERDLDIRDFGIADASARVQVIDGYVINVFGKRVLPNHILSLFVIPIQAKKFNSETLNLPIEGRKSFQETIEILLDKFADGGEKYTPVFDFTPEELATINKTLFSNRHWAGDYSRILAQVCDSVNTTFRLEGYKITFTTFKTPDQMKAEADYSQETSKLIGTTHKLYPINLRGLPQIGMATFECTTVLDPKMKSFDVVDVTAILAADGGSETNAIATIHNGKEIFYDDSVEIWGIFPRYMIKTFVHSGSNYTDLWDTSINCVVFRDSLSLLQRGMVVNHDDIGRLRLKE